MIFVPKPREPAPVLPAPAPAPVVPPLTLSERAALSKALDHTSAAAYVAKEGDLDSASRLAVLACKAAAQEFPAGSRVSIALAVILAAIGGAS